MAYPLLCYYCVLCDGYFNFISKHERLYTFKRRHTGLHTANHRKTTARAAAHCSSKLASVDNKIKNTTHRNSLNCVTLDVACSQRLYVANLLFSSSLQSPLLRRVSFLFLRRLREMPHFTHRRPGSLPALNSKMFGEKN